MNDSTLKFRRYEESDVEDVVAIFRSNIPKYFTPAEEAELRAYLAGGVEDFYVAVMNGEVIGAGGIGLNDDDSVSLCWGMVRSDHIGTGIGKRLTQYRIERAVEKFNRKVMVTSTSQHTEGFYNKFGFVTIEHTPDGFAPGIDICKMRREP